MYIAMNRFRVRLGEEEAFEAVWRNRQSHLDSVPGFKEFRLLKGPSKPDHTLYASHSLWETEAAFLAWTKSEAFRAAHKDAGASKGHYDGPPEFEGFTSVDGV